MSDFQQNKALVLNFQAVLDNASGNGITDVLRRHTADEYHWRGMHPFDEHHGADAVAEVFWKPFRHSFTSVRRRTDVFFAGLNDGDGFGDEWVCSMGHLMDPLESGKTLALINQLIADLTLNYEKSPEHRLTRCWHNDMAWFGPAGIGATYTREHCRKQHQDPFRGGLRDISFNGHVCRLAEGRYGGFFGWPNLTMKSRGGFLGLPACDQTTEMRVVDIYRRAGDKLAENWIFIDLLHFLHRQGLDLLGQMPESRAD